MLLVNVGLICERFRRVLLAFLHVWWHKNLGQNLTLFFFVMLRVEDAVWASSEGSHVDAVTTWCRAQRSRFDTAASMKRSESLCHLEKGQRDTSLPIWFRHVFFIPVLSTSPSLLNNWTRAVWRVNSGGQEEWGWVYLERLLCCDKTKNPYAEKSDRFHL